MPRRSSNNLIALGAGILLFAGALVFFVQANSNTSDPDPRVTVKSEKRNPTPTNTVQKDEARSADARENEKEVAADFTLTSLSGSEVQLSSYVGKKPVVLDFFATWCPNCQRAMPQLNEWYEMYQDEVEVIGVNLQEDQAVVQAYVDDSGITFPVVLEPSGATARKYGIRYTNTHVLINTDGTIEGIIPGDLTEADVTDLIDNN